jgi:hypothetical protein
MERRVQKTGTSDPHRPSPSVPHCVRPKSIVSRRLPGRVHRAIVGTLTGAALLVTVGLASARDDASCGSTSCPVAAIATARDRIARACDCAGVSNPPQYMQCVRRQVASAVSDGVLARRCKAATTRCEAALACGRGIRPFRAIQGTFAASCALPSCHSAGGRKGELVLDNEELSYASLVGQPAALAAGSGDGMPQGGAKLSSKVMKAIESHARQGHPEAVPAREPRRGSALELRLHQRRPGRSEPPAEALPRGLRGVRLGSDDGHVRVHARGGDRRRRRAAGLPRRRPHAARGSKLSCALGLGLVLGGTATAGPGVLTDHLKCYKGKDSAAKATYTATLTPLFSAAFPNETGCTVKVPATLL